MIRSLILMLVAMTQAPSVPNGWTNYTPPGAGFAIALPAKPTAKTVTQQAKSGPIEVLDVSAEAEGCLYKVERTRMPRPFGPANEQGALDAIVKSIAKKTTLKGERTTTVGGHPGRDLLVEAPLRLGSEPSAIAIRIVVADRDLYQVRVFALKPGTQPRAVEEFFGSFRIETMALP